MGPSKSLTFSRGPKSCHVRIRVLFINGDFKDPVIYQPGFHGSCHYKSFVATSKSCFFQDFPQPAVDLDENQLSSFPLNPGCFIGILISWCMK